MKQTHFMCWIFLFFLCMLPSCKKRQILKKSYLKPLTSYIDYEKAINGVTLRAKLLSPQDCISLLGIRAHRLYKKQRLKKPIYPIQISITNNTRNLAALDPKDIDLQLVNCQLVINRLNHNTFVQAFGGMAASIVVTSALALGSIFALSASGMLLVIIGSMKALAPLAILGGTALVVTPMFLVIGTPVFSTVKGVQTAQYNKQMKGDINKYALKHVLIVEPGETIDTLIFVEKQYYEQEFNIGIANPENAKERITFRVKLGEPYSSGAQY